MSGKGVDIITTWAEAAEVLGVSYRSIKAMYKAYADCGLPMPIEVRGRRILTTRASLQEWADQRAERARQGQKNEAGQ
jgi:predicted DNA-binding transcriptional regulator AlpA